MRKQIALKHTYRHVYTYPGASTECHSFNVFINTFNNDAKSKLLEFKLGALSRHLELLLNALLHSIYCARCTTQSDKSTE